MQKSLAHINFSKSKIERYNFSGLEFLLKRDDLLSTYINGNKAYKFYFLIHSKFDTIISYGGNQSNAMATLSYIAKIKNAQFVYFTNPPSTYLKNNPSGNFKFALKNGATFKFSNNFINDFHTFTPQSLENTIKIPQGGACEQARYGIEKLAQSIIALKLENLCVCTSSGTGTSAVLLGEYLKPHNIDVLTTPCIGDKAYLLKCFSVLCKDSALFPCIINTTHKYRFANPNPDIKSIYDAWLKYGVEFDLLYDCVMWRAILDNIKILQSYTNRLFLHSGGLSGNETQLLRYKFHNI